MKLSLVLLGALIIFQAQDTIVVAVTIDSQIVLMKKSEVEKLLASPNQKLRAAAVIALGTLPSNEVKPSSMTPQDLERHRWHRLATQTQH